MGPEDEAGDPSGLEVELCEASIAVDLGDERSPVGGDEAADAAESLDDGLGGLWSGEILRHDHEHRHLGVADSFHLEPAVPDSLVPGDHEPAATADLGQPLFVGSVLGEVVVMQLDGEAGLTASVPGLKKLGSWALIASPVMKMTSSPAPYRSFVAHRPLCKFPIEGIGWAWHSTG